MSMLVFSQVRTLLGPLNPRRRRVSNNQAHMEAYEIRAHLNRVFGFANWDGDVIESSLVFEDLFHRPAYEKNGKTIPASDRVTVAYRVRYRLVVRDPDGLQCASYTEEAVGEAPSQPQSNRADAHDFALKTAESQALKRCAINLGDQFGLSLYGRSWDKPLVGRTLVMPKDTPAERDANTTPNDAVDRDVEQVAPEGMPFMVPEAEQPWMEKALELAADPNRAPFLDDLYNDARKAHVSNATLSEIKKVMTDGAA